MNDEPSIAGLFTLLATMRSETQNGFSRVDARLDHAQADIAEIKTDVAGLKTDVAGLKTDVAGLKTDVAGLTTDVAGLTTDVAGLKTDVAGLSTRLERYRAEMIDGFMDLRDATALAIRYSESRLIDRMDRRFRSLDDRFNGHEARLSALEGA
jgi:septal ring factor EnvC (AmiA/AmiB activator)